MCISPPPSWRGNIVNFCRVEAVGLSAPLQDNSLLWMYMADCTTHLNQFLKSVDITIAQIPPCLDFFPVQLKEKKSNIRDLIIFYFSHRRTSGGTGIVSSLKLRQNSSPSGTGARKKMIWMKLKHESVAG